MNPDVYKTNVLSHCAKVQKYEQGKIGLQFFDMWCNVIICKMLQ